MSSLHKELRRGDAGRALATAMLLIPMKGEGEIRTYIRSIVMEETRNTDMLFHRAAPAKRLSAFDWVTWMAQSKKKWEVPCRVGIFKRKLAAFTLAKKDLADLTPAVAVGKATDLILNGAELEDLYRGIWLGKMLKEEFHFIGAKMEEVVCRRIEDSKVGDGLEWVAKYLGISIQGRTYHQMMGAETVFGLWTPECNEVWDEAARPIIPVTHFGRTLPDYVHDCHTQKGKGRIKRFWPEIQPGKPLPAGVDLRWSGSILGVAWRYFAVEQHGPHAYREMPWEAVDFGDWWPTIVECDKIWYAEWYEKLDALYPAAP